MEVLSLCLHHWMILPKIPLKIKFRGGDQNLFTIEGLTVIISYSCVNQEVWYKYLTVKLCLNEKLRFIND